MHDGRYVYFITNGTAVKIGASSHPPTRLAHLQCAHYDNLFLLASQLGGVSLEQKLHKRFEHLRLRGEWFKLEGDLLSYLYIIGIPEDINTIIGLEHECAEIVEDASRIAKDIVAQAHIEEKKIVSQEYETLKDRLTAAEKEKQEIITAANIEKARLLSWAKREHEHIIRQAQIEAEELKRQEQCKMNQMIQDAKSEIHLLIKQLAAKCGLSYQEFLQAKRSASVSRFKFDCRCIICGQPQDNVILRSDGNKWCDYCWNHRNINHEETANYRDIASRAYSMKQNWVGEYR